MGFGITELILIAVVALVVIGPKKLPDVAKSLGKGYGEFKRSFGDLKQAVNLDDLDKTLSGRGSSSQSSVQKEEERREDIIDTYRSQWEQKLPEPAAQVKSESPVSSPQDAVAEPKKDGGESSGR